MSRADFGQRNPRLQKTINGRSPIEQQNLQENKSGISGFRTIWKSCSFALSERSGTRRAFTRRKVVDATAPVASIDFKEKFQCKSRCATLPRCTLRSSVSYYSAALSWPRY